MIEKGKTRRGREWEKGAKVCPRDFAQRGEFVEGEVVMIAPLPQSYRPPNSYQWQENAYLVEWPAGTTLAPLALGRGIFLGDDLLTHEEAMRCATHALAKEKDRLIDSSGITRKEARLRQARPKRVHAGAGGRQRSEK